MPSSRATPLVPTFNGADYFFLSLARYFRAIKPVSHIDQIGYHFVGVTSLGLSQYEVASVVIPILTQFPTSHTAAPSSVANTPITTIQPLSASHGSS
jgi:hypothetical protein